MKAFLFLISVILILGCSSGEKKCTILGGISDARSKSVVLFKASHFPSQEAEIPISNGRFTHTFTFTEPEVYWIVCKNKLNSSVINEVPFFSESGKITFTINGETGAYEIKGHKLNDALTDYYRQLNQKFYSEAQKYKDSVNAMYRNGTVFSKEFQDISNALKNTKDPGRIIILQNAQRNIRTMGGMYNPRAKKFVELQDSIAKEQKKWEMEYIDSNTSVPSLYLFMKKIKELAASRKGKELEAPLMDWSKKNYDKYSAEYPGHPYIQIVKNTMEGFNNIYEGGKYIDFTATNTKGDSLALSNLLKENKLVLLDFWSTWSEPSLKASKDLVPIYNTYKEKGFDIVGVTHVYGKADEAMNVIQKENFPWTNLIDVDNKAGAWEKYNLSYQSGGNFLLNSSGEIVAADLSPDEVKAKVSEMLK